MSESKFPDGLGTAYVEKLRKENGKYGQRAQKADQLHTELVRATGKLANQDDMPFDEIRLDDPPPYARRSRISSTASRSSSVGDRP